MIEGVLISGGLGCGSVKNFANEVVQNMELTGVDKWYFSDPIQYSGHGLRSATINFAFPFRAIDADAASDKLALARIELLRKSYEDDLIKFLRQFFIVPPDSANFTVIPFYSGNTSQRTDRSNFGQTVIHILNAVITVKYREEWFKTI